MSVQLELYPQNYEGYVNAGITTSANTNFVSNGEEFAPGMSPTPYFQHHTISGPATLTMTSAEVISALHQGIQFFADPILSPSPNNLTPFQWFEYKTLNDNCTASFPVIVIPYSFSGTNYGNVCRLGGTACSNAQQTGGIFQQLDGLTVGVVYTISVQIVYAPTFSSSSLN